MLLSREKSFSHFLPHSCLLIHIRFSLTSFYVCFTSNLFINTYCCLKSSFTLDHLVFAPMFFSPLPCLLFTFGSPILLPSPCLPNALPLPHLCLLLTLISPSTPASLYPHLPIQLSVTLIFSFTIAPLPPYLHSHKVHRNSNMSIHSRFNSHSLVLEFSDVDASLEWKASRRWVKLSIHGGKA